MYLERNYVRINNVIYNKTTNGIKNGDWIKYGINSDNGLLIHWDGDINCGDEYIYKEYKALNANEHRGQFTIIKSDSIVREDYTFFQTILKEIDNRIPPEAYNITAKGKYLNNKKTGIWTFYYESGKIKKIIAFKDGIPFYSFKILREDGKLLVSAEKINNSKWKISKYSNIGKVIKIEYGRIEDYKILY